MNSDLQKEIIEALVACDIEKLKILRQEVKDHAFLDQFIAEDGIGNVPIAYWLSQKE